MAAFPMPVGGTLRVAVQGTFDDDVNVVNVFALGNTGSQLNSASDALEDIADWVAALLALLKVLQNVVMVWESFSLSTWDSQYTSGDVALSPTIAGTAVGGALPPGAAMLQYFNTGVPRRQARKYFGPVDASTIDADTGSFDSAAVSAGLDLATFLLVTYTGTHSTYKYGLYSVEQTVHWLVPNGAYVTANPAYQRRRRRGAGA